MAQYWDEKHLGKKAELTVTRRMIETYNSLSLGKAIGKELISNHD